MIALVKLRKMFFILLQKLISFSWKSNFLNSMTSSNAETLNKKYILFNNSRGKLSLFMKFGQFMSYSKGNNFIKRLYKNWGQKPVPGFFLCFQRVKNNLSWKMKFLKKSANVKYVIAKLLKLVQMRMLASPNSFLQVFLWKFKRRAWR